MCKNKPLIAITPGYDDEKCMSYVKKGYYEGIVKAGGTPLLMPLVTDEDTMLEYINVCDGFLISGGPDMDARYYGEYNLPFNGEISPHRDEFEVFIIKEAIRNNKPLLGICRGIQVINVALGGTLYQDIHYQMKGAELIKHSQNAPRWYPTHDIRIEKDSKVCASFSMRECVGVNSFHHQAVKDIAPGFRVTARADDGVIEAIEHIDYSFVVGVQWHPELMWQDDPAFLKLFIDFLNHCKV